MDTPEQTSRGVASAVRAALASAGVSHRDAAERTGIPSTTLHRRLTGASPFNVTELDKIASLTATTVSALIAAGEQAGQDVA